MRRDNCDEAGHVDVTTTDSERGETNRDENDYVKAIPANETTIPANEKAALENEKAVL